jgi:hypothetical protein
MRHLRKRGSLERREISCQNNITEAEGLWPTDYITDEAKWIRKLVEEHCPDAVGIVAWYYAVKHIWKGTHAVDGEGGHFTEASADKPLTELREGDLETVLFPGSREPNPRDEQAQKAITLFLF